MGNIEIVSNATNDVNILFDFSIKLLVYLILVVFLCCLDDNITKGSFCTLNGRV